jgi:hypothetical protein
MPAVEYASFANWLNWPSRLWAVGPSTGSSFVKMERLRIELRGKLFDARFVDHVGT